VYVFTRSEASFTLIEDDGVSLMYYAGAYTAVHLSLTSDGDDLVAQAQRQHNGYPLPYHEVTFIVVTDHQSIRGGTLDQGRWRVVVPVS